MDGWGTSPGPQLARHGDQHAPHRMHRIWGQAPSRWLPLREGKRSRTITGYQSFSPPGPASENVRAAPAADGRVTSHPRTPSRHILRRTDPASEYVRAARCDPGRQSGQARSSGYLRTNPPAGPSPSPTWRVSRDHTPGCLPSGGGRLPPCGTPLPLRDGGTPIRG